MGLTEQSILGQQEVRENNRDKEKTKGGGGRWEGKQFIRSNGKEMKDWRESILFLSRLL